jgi:hypothetical protein
VDSPECRTNAPDKARDPITTGHFPRARLCDAGDRSWVDQETFNSRCRIVPPSRLRPCLADAVQRGVAGTFTREDGKSR